MKKLTQKGISLIEVLVATAIFGTLLGVLMGMMAQDRELIRNSQRLLKAQLQANEVMETLKTIPFGELESSSTSLVSELDPQTVEVVISDFDGSELLKKIVVTAKWLDHTERERKYILTTLRSQFSMIPMNDIKETALSTDEKGGSS